jgi:Domain of unknown function (DUF4276)
VDKNDRMTFLEDAMKALIDPKLSHRFIPYIQLHEFEGLLFNNIDVFKEQIDLEEFRDFDYLLKTINDYPNPELINDGKTTAPSKRLERHIVGYNKIVYGSILAEAIGLQRIRSKCPRFNHWITTLEGV